MSVNNTCEIQLPIKTAFLFKAMTPCGKYKTFVISEEGIFPWYEENE